MIRVGCFRCGLIRRLIWERSRRGGLNLMVSEIRIIVYRWGIRMLTGCGGRLCRFRWSGGGGSRLLMLGFVLMGCLRILLLEWVLGLCWGLCGMRRMMGGLFMILV